PWRARPHRPAAARRGASVRPARGTATPARATALASASEAHGLGELRLLAQVRPQDRDLHGLLLLLHPFVVLLLQQLLGDRVAILRERGALRGGLLLDPDPRHALGGLQRVAGGTRLHRE